MSKYPKLTDAEARVLEEVSREAQIPEPMWLYKMIDHESGWNPKAVNPMKGATAKGLIQFIDSTAKDLGYLNSRDLINRHPTRISQLEGPVLRFYKTWAPYANRKEFTMAAFLPALRKMPIDEQIPEKYWAWNPGIKTPRDLIRRVHGDDLPWQVVAAIGLGGLLLYILTKGGKVWQPEDRRGTR